eukprot:gene643-210_t
MLKSFVSSLGATAAAAIQLKSDDNGIKMGDIYPNSGGASNPANAGEAESTTTSQPAAPQANQMEDREGRCEAPNCPECCKLFMDYVLCGPCFLTHRLHPTIKERWREKLFETEPGGDGIARLTFMKNGKKVERDPNEKHGPAHARKKHPWKYYASAFFFPCTGEVLFTQESTLCGCITATICFPMNFCCIIGMCSEEDADVSTEICCCVAMCCTSIVACPCWAVYTLNYTCRQKDGCPVQEDHEWQW